MMHLSFDCQPEETCSNIAEAVTACGNQPVIIDLLDVDGKRFSSFRAQSESGNRELRGWASVGLSQQTFHTHNEPTILALPPHESRNHSTVVIDTKSFRDIAESHGIQLDSDNSFEIDDGLNQLKMSMSESAFRDLLSSLHLEVPPENKIRWDDIPEGHTRFAIIPSSEFLHAQEYRELVLPARPEKIALRWAFLSTIR